MKKFTAIFLALVLICGQAYAFSVTKTTEERFTNAENGVNYRRVNGYLTLDSSHPAEGESLIPTQLGMASFTRVSIESQGPDANAWPTPAVGATVDVPRRFGFDYTTNKIYVITTQTFPGAAGAGYGNVDVSGPITYDLAYLTRVPFEALGPIS